ncbi:MAG: homoserine kinase [Terriglobia bacterium]|jgi:homoserine kinase
MSDRVSIRVPATGANLGCLFDCGGIALSLYLDIRVTPRADDEIVVHYRGVNVNRVHVGADNLIARTIRETLRAWGKTRGFELEIENQIPVGAGVGASAAAILGAVAASHRLADRTLFDEEIVSLAARREGHPDNVAAAWHGGFTVAMESAGRILSYSCPVPEPLGLVLVVPDYALPTEEARKVLPEKYSRADAVHNLQRAAALTAQFFSGKAELHRCLFDDRWHQSFRAHLVPGLPEVLALEHPDLLGVCLSGAGPSLLAFARGDTAAIGELIQNTLGEKQVQAHVYQVAADNRGAKGWILPD